MILARLRSRFPRAYALLRDAYVRTPRHQEALRQQLEERNRRGAQRRAEEKALVDEHLLGRYVVANGPFAGMAYIADASGSALLPKLLGSYEEPIHPWIDELITHRSYDVIINVGCAEGYYAVGLARALPGCQVIAYDIDAEARERTTALAHRNGVPNVRVLAECTFAELDAHAGPRSLVLCDVEGYERELLDPSRSAALRRCDLVVECHDFLVPGVADLLIERFWETHVIHAVVDYPFRVRRYVAPDGTALASEVVARLADEQRPPRMRFLRMTAR